MSRRGEGGTQVASHGTSSKQLLRCYGPIPYGKRRKFERGAVRSHTSSDSGAITSSSVSRLAEPRLRPQTCTACQACVAAKLQRSRKQTDIPKLQPLSKTNHLPYYSGTDSERGPKMGPRRGGAKIMQLPDSRKLISCQFKTSRSFPSSISSKSSKRSEVKITDPPEPSPPYSSGLPSLSFSCLGPHLSHSSDAELRKWIVEFGGDERAAFMARGLQKLQLAYEKGKMEMNQQPEDCTPSAEDDCR